MKARNFVILLGMTFVIPTLAETTREVSLQDALLLAEKKSPDLEAARASAQSVIAQASRVWGAVLPSITLNGSLVRTSAPQKLDFSPILQMFQPSAIRPEALAAPPAPTYIVARDSAYASLEISQILFTPQMFALAASKHGPDAAKWGALEAREQILLGVARIYLGIEGLVQLEAAAKDADVVAQKREKDAIAQIKAGLQTEVALLRAQTDAAQAKSLLIQLAGQREALIAMLESLCGEPVAPPMVPVAKPNFGRFAAEDTDPWKGSYSIRSAESAVKTQESLLLASRVAMLPTVLAIAKGNYNSNKGFVNTNWTGDIILALSLPLYDRGDRYATMHDNEAKLAAARAQFASAKAKAKANWISARANLVAAEAALAQSEAQAQLALRAQKQVEAAFNSGVTTSLELSDVDSKRFLAASAAAQSRAQVEIRKVEMAAAEGRLAKALGLEEKK